VTTSQTSHAAKPATPTNSSGEPSAMARFPAPVDYFLLARIEGSWKIVCKLFAHTDGELPEGI
jgi:hypothetical protein